MIRAAEKLSCKCWSREMLFSMEQYLNWIFSVFQADHMLQWIINNRATPNGREQWRIDPPIYHLVANFLHDFDGELEGKWKIISWMARTPNVFLFEARSSIAKSIMERRKKSVSCPPQWSMEIRENLRKWVMRKCNNEKTQRNMNRRKKWKIVQKKTKNISFGLICRRFHCRLTSAED